MSMVTVAEVKAWMRVIHSGDDAFLSRLIEQAEDEALQFLNLEEPPLTDESSDADIVESYRKAVCILVQAAYEQPDPDKAATMRRNAEVVLFPYRRCLGV